MVVPPSARFIALLACLAVSVAFVHRHASLTCVPRQLPASELWESPRMPSSSTRNRAPRRRCPQGLWLADARVLSFFTSSEACAANDSCQRGR